MTASAADQMTALDWIVSVGWTAIVWISIIWWFRKNRSTVKVVPLAWVPISFAWFQMKPAIDYWLLKRDLRRHERIRAFLKLADDLWMRKKPLDGFLPRRPGS
jgi:hypothetical protein